MRCSLAPKVPSVRAALPFLLSSQLSSGADFGRPASRGSPRFIVAPGRSSSVPNRRYQNSAPQAARYLVVLAHSNNFGEPQSVPATLRRHASRVHPSCIHTASRFSASANGNSHLVQEPATSISTPPSSPQSETPQARQVGVVAFSSQHLIPLLLQSAHLPGNSKIGSQQKSQAEAWDLILSFPILAGDRARILTLWGAFSGAPHFRHKGDFTLSLVPPCDFAKTTWRGSERRRRTADRR